MEASRHGEAGGAWSSHRRVEAADVNLGCRGQDSMPLDGHGLLLGKKHRQGSWGAGNILSLNLGAGWMGSFHENLMSCTLMMHTFVTCHTFICSIKSFKMVEFAIPSSVLGVFFPLNCDDIFIFFKYKTIDLISFMLYRYVVLP